MLKVTLVGNLGANAEVKVANGRPFVSFKVADSRKYQRADGQEVEETTWVSCALNGDGGKLLPYLVKGAKVLVIGRASFDVYSSPTLRRMVAGVNLSVDSVELIGGSVRDAVPRQLITSDGAIVDVLKYYWVEQPKQSEKYTELFTERGSRFKVTPEGWVSPIEEEPAAEAAQPTPVESNNAADSDKKEQKKTTSKNK